MRMLQAYLPLLDPSPGRRQALYGDAVNGDVLLPVVCLLVGVLR
jgi:hypothetical protein